jgi:hypothetical protein
MTVLASGPRGSDCVWLTLRRACVKAGVLAMLVYFGSPSAALSASPLPVGTLALSPAVASPATRYVAYLESPGVVVIVGGRRTIRMTVPPSRFPPPCLPKAITPTELFVCESINGSGGPLVGRLDGGVFVPVAVGQRPLQDQTFRVIRAGSHWLIGVLSLTVTTGRTVKERVVVSRSTGTVTPLSYPATEDRRWGPRRWLDLDSRDLARRLCTPVRRRRVPRVGWGYHPLVQVGRWNLVGVESPGVTRYFLQRCGSRTRLPTGRYPVLSRTHAAWLTGIDNQTTITVLNLRTGRKSRYAAPGSEGAPPLLAMAADRLVISEEAGPPTTALPRPWRIRSVRLR